MGCNLNGNFSLRTGLASLFDLKSSLTKIRKMDYSEKTKEELIQEIIELQNKYDVLFASAENTSKKLEKEKHLIEKLISSSAEFIQFSGIVPDYSKIVQGMMEISGASYAALNIFDDDGLSFTTVAFEGLRENIRNGISLLGFDPINKHWKHDPVRAEKTKNRNITQFHHLHELTGKVIPKLVIHLIEKTFQLEESFVVKVVKEEKVIGDFTLLFKKGESLKNFNYAELFANQAGMFLERNKINKSLHLSEARHLALIANISDVIAIMDSKGIIQYKSPNIHKLFGWAPEDLIGKNGWDTVHPEDLQAIRDEFISLLERENEAKTIEYRYKCKDETYKWIELRAINLSKDKLIHGVLMNYHDISARKQAESELRASEKKSSLILHAIPDMMFVQSREGVYIDYYLPENAVRCIPPKVFIGQKMENVLTPEIIEGFLPIFEDTLKTKKIHFFEYPLMVRDQMRYFEARIISFDEDKILSIVRDVTSVKEAENELKASEERFRILYNASFGGIAIHDKGLILDCNNGLTEITGYASPELVGMDGLQLIAPEWRDFTRQKILSDYPNAYEVQGIRKDGSIYPLLIRGKNVTYRGHVVRTTEFRDITQHKQAEKALMESELHYRTIVENTNDAIYIHDFEGNIIDINDNVCRMLGYSREELIGANLSSFGSAKNAEKIHERIKILRKKGRLRFEAIDIRKDGTPVDVDVSSTVIYKEGKPIIQSFVRDISELKKNELIIMDQNAELQKLNTDKDRFISILAHDLKSPFNSLLGFSELLKKNLRIYDINKIEKQVNIINNNAKNIYNLLEDILLWVHIQKGKIMFEPQSFHFGRLCDQIIENIKISADLKNIRIKYDPGHEIMIKADLNMFKTIMRNLVSNAIKFNNHGGLVNIMAKTDQSNVIITVIDNGIGIAPESISKLFDISQVFTTRGTADEQGTGLGLLLCKELVEKQGGRIWVESKVGKGSKFNFSLPIQQPGT